MPSESKTGREDQKPVVSLTGRRLDRSGLERLFHAQLEYDEIRGIRLVLVHWLAVLGVAVWLRGWWPSIVPAWVDSAAPLLWPPCVAGAATAAIAEAFCYRRCRRSLSDYDT
jgi:hypothetical protein